MIQFVSLDSLSLLGLIEIKVGKGAYFTMRKKEDRNTRYFIDLDLKTRTVFQKNQELTKETILER